MRPRKLSAMWIESHGPDPARFLDESDPCASLDECIELGADQEESSSICK